MGWNRHHTSLWPITKYIDISFRNKVNIPYLSQYEVFQMENTQLNPILSGAQLTSVIDENVNLDGIFLYSSDESSNGGKVR